MLISSPLCICTGLLGVVIAGFSAVLTNFYFVSEHHVRATNSNPVSVITGALCLVIILTVSAASCSSLFFTECVQEYTPNGYTVVEKHLESLWDVRSVHTSYRSQLLGITAELFISNWVRAQ